MTIRRSLIATLGVVSLAATCLAGCSNAGKEAADTGKSAAGATVELKVGASPTPHAKILQFVNDKLAAKEGLKITVVQYQDYIQPNEALRSGDLDANYFQTVPYLKDQTAKQGYQFTAGKGIHLEPLGVYSTKVKEISDLKDGAKIGFINDPTNQQRGLQLLAENNLVKLPTSGEVNVSQIQNSPEFNPHKLVFQLVEGPQLVRTLDDVDAAVINGNFAQAGGKSPRDAIALESTKNNPAANVLVWPTDTTKAEAIAKLEKLLHSDEVRDYIQQTWPDKSVIPVF